MQQSESTMALISGGSLAAIAGPVSTLCFIFFYLSLATFAFALGETVYGIIKKDDRSLGWWRRSRLVALTYSQMYLSQHFLRILIAGKDGLDLPEKSFWMASQSIAAGVLLFSSFKAPRTAERLLIGEWYSAERPQIAQIIFTLAVAFNVLMIAGPISSVITIISLLVGLDWKLQILTFEGIAAFHTWMGNEAAELVWGILHLGLAIGTIKAVHNIDKKEGLISLPTDEEALENNEKIDLLSNSGDEEEEEEEEEEAEPTNLEELPAGHMFLRFCVLIIFAGAAIVTTFFMLEKFLLPKFISSKNHIDVEGLILSQIFTMDAIGVILVLALTTREIYHNTAVKSMIFDQGGVDVSIEGIPGSNVDSEPSDIIQSFTIETHCSRFLMLTLPTYASGPRLHEGLLKVRIVRIVNNAIDIPTANCAKVMQAVNQGVSCVVARQPEAPKRVNAVPADRFCGPLDLRRMLGTPAL
ncbi:hypothetical protein ABW19_dt0206324 [Dactylella cylindrospora]|nr:hypothetical protein ABW19_dt0206324 [Dactylella cylindrospora]